MPINAKSLVNALKALRILLRLVFLSYYIISLSYRLCFLENQDIFGNRDIVFIFFDYLVDAFFVLDFILLVREGTTARITVRIDFEPEESKIAAHQLVPQDSVSLIPLQKEEWWPTLMMYSELFLQVAMIFPTEVIGYAAGFDRYPWLRVTKVLRLLYFPFYWKQFTGLLEIYRIVQSAGLHRIVLIMYIMGMCGHFSACAFYAIALDDMRRRGNDNTWLVVDGLASFGADGEVLLHRPLSYRFLRATYWAFQTIASVAFGDIAAFSEPETWYCIFYFYLTGLCVYFSVANLIMVITNFDSARNDNLRKVAKFNKYATYRRLPPELNNRVLSYYSYQWQLLKGVDENEILSELPSNIAQQVLHLMVRDLLIQIDALKSMNKALLNALSERAESYIYSPTDVIVDFESKVVGVYVISAGEIERVRCHNFSSDSLVDAEGKPQPCSLNSGQYFGSSALFKSYVSKHRYKAQSFAEVLLLRGSVYRHLCKLYLSRDQLEEMNATIDELTRDALEEERTVKLHRVHKPDGKESSHFNTMNPLPYLESAIARSDRHWKNKIFAPHANFRILWDVWLFCGLLFYLVTCGLLLGAMLRDHFYQHYFAILVSCYVIDAFFAAEFLLRSSAFGFHNEGVVVTKSILILKKQISDPLELALQLLETLPFDIICGYTIDIRLIPILRLLKLVHVRKLLYYLRNTEDALRQFFGIALSFEMSRFLHLYLCLFFMVHWGASIWSLTSSVAIKVFKFNTSWRINDTSGDFFDVKYSGLGGTAFYIRSIYWAINVFACIGFADMLADNPVEMVTIIFIMFFGYLLFNTLLGAIATLMSNFNKDKREFDSKVEKVKQLMKYKSVPSEIEAKIQRYYEYIWARYGGVNESEVMSSLPKSLRAAVAGYVVGPFLKKIPFFAICSEPMEQTLVGLFRPRIFLHDDPLMICGELGREMFIIEKGEVVVMSADRKLTFATLHVGDYIGESSLLDLTKRTASVFAVKYVDTYYLTCEDFLKAAEKFPSEYGTIIESINDVLQEKLKFNAAVTVTAGTTITEDEFKVVNVKNVKEVSVKRLERSHAGGFFYVKWKVNPDSRFRIAWDVMMFLVLFYNAVIIPLRIAVNISPLVFILDYCGDLLNFADSYLYYTVFTLYQGGQLLSENPEIQSNYIKKRLLVDALSQFPYEIFLLAFLGYKGRTFLLIWAMFRVPKLIKCLLLRHYLKQVELLSKVLNLSYIMFRFFDLTFSILIICHFVACGFFCFPKYGKRPGDCENLPTDVDVLGERTYACEYRATWVEMAVFYRKLPPSGGNEWQRLVRAFDWTIPTLTAETMGDIWVMNQYECLFAFLVIFFGLTVNAMIIGSIINLVTDVSEETSMIYRSIELLGSYLEQEQVPQELIQSSARLLRHQASDEGALIVSQERLLAELPQSIQATINEHIKTTPFLKRCPIFDFCPDEVLRSIASRLQQTMYVRGDQIVTYGELGHEMFFLENGTVNVVSEDGKTLYSTLEDGAFFGETALFFHSTRTATIVVASPFCVCLVLTKGDLDHELRSSDIEEDSVISAFKTLQSTNKRRNEAVTDNLALALDPNHKLYKMIHHNAPRGKTFSYYLTMIRTYLAPESYFRLCWDILGMLFLVYYVFSIPFALSFIFGDNIRIYKQRILPLDIIVDTYWVLDIIAKAWLFSYKEDMFHDRIITDGDAIWHNYRTEGHFFFDFCASIPFELLSLVPNVHSMTLFIARVPHLLRVPQLLSYSVLVEHHVRRKLQINMKRTVLLLLKIGFAYMTLNHWLSCGYFMIHRYAERTYDWTYVIADRQATYDPRTGEHNICDVGVSYCYARAIYLVVTIMAGIGYGDIGPFRSPEFVYQMTVAILGAYIAATVLGFCGMFLEDRDANGVTSFKKKIRTVETYINFRRLESPERDALLAQYTYIWNKMKSTKSNRNHILSQLSPSTAMELSLHLQARILSTVPMFDSATYRIKRRVAFALRPQIALVGSNLYCAGDVSYAVFFVSSGMIQISLSKNYESLDACGMSSLTMLMHKEEFHGSEYESGTHFGEYCVLSKSGLRPDNAIAVTTSEVYALIKEDLWDIFLYMTYTERRAFLCDLFTRVGKKRHINYTPKSEEEIGAGDERLKLLFRTSNRLLSELIDVLDQEINGSDSDSDDAGEMTPSDAALKQLVRQETMASNNSLSQRDLMYLLDELRPTGPMAANRPVRAAPFSPAAATPGADPYPRRINRQVSIPDDVSSVLRNRRSRSNRGSVSSVPESEEMSKFDDADNSNAVAQEDDDNEDDDNDDDGAAVSPISREYTIDIDGNIAASVKSSSRGSCNTPHSLTVPTSFTPQDSGANAAAANTPMTPSISPDAWDRQAGPGFVRTLMDSPNLNSHAAVRERRHALQVMNLKLARAVHPEQEGTDGGSGSGDNISAGAADQQLNGSPDAAARPKLSMKLPPLEPKHSLGSTVLVGADDKSSSEHKGAAGSELSLEIDIAGNAVAADALRASEEKLESSTYPPASSGGSSKPQRRHSFNARGTGGSSKRRVSFIPDDSMDAEGRLRQLPSYSSPTAAAAGDGSGRSFADDAGGGARAGLDMAASFGRDDHLSVLRNAMEIEERILGIKRPKSVEIKRREASIQIRGPKT